MNQRFDFTQLGGFPLTQNVLDFMQVSYRGALGALADMIGSNTIISGVVVNTVTNTVSDGWISYNGELMPFRGGGLSAGVVIQETGEDMNFFTGDAHTVKFTKFATCGSPETFLFSSLKPPQSVRDIWCKGDIKMVDCDAPYIAANFDSATGLGRNERLGWAFCDGRDGRTDRRGRISISYDDRIIDPGNNIWDVAYNTPGALGGQLRQILTLANIPKHDHTMHAKGPIPGSGGPFFLTNKVQSYSGNGGNVLGGRTTVDTDMRTGDAGGDGGGATTPFDQRNPFIVTLFIQKL